MMSLFTMLTIADALVKDSFVERVNDTVHNVTQTAEAIVTGAIEGLVDLFGPSAGLSVAS